MLGWWDHDIRTRYTFTWWYNPLYHWVMVLNHELACSDKVIYSSRRKNTYILSRNIYWNLNLIHFCVSFKKYMCLEHINPSYLSHWTRTRIPQIFLILINQGSKRTLPSWLHTSTANESFTWTYIYIYEQILNLITRLFCRLSHLPRSLI